jgi:hypothetical protein
MGENGRQPQKKSKMEDDLQKNGRRPQQNKWKMTPNKIMESNLKRNKI